MASVFSENLKVYNAEQFKKSISDVGPTNIYLTIGRSYPWPNDAQPTQANSSVAVFNDIWKNMIGAKLITGSDVRHVVPRHNWTYGTIYDSYDHCVCSILLFDANVKFFVVTSNWNVYKCLENNRGGPSLVMPTQTITNTVVEESDGYVWKFMYNISSEERLRFTTNSYIPVKTLEVDNGSLQWQVQDEATGGAIDAIKLVSGGTNYTSAPVITIVGDGTGANAIATVNTVSNVVNRIVVTNPGAGYTYADIIFSFTGTGTGVSARAMISPPGGHGKDPLRELGGSYIIMNPRLSYTEDGKLPTDNEFRQVSILQDPRELATSNIATSTVYSQTLKLITNSGVSNFVEDEIVYQGASLEEASFIGTVVAWDSSNNTLRLSNTTGDVETDIIVGANSAVVRYVESITEKQLIDYSGELLYVDNIVPIQRADDQTEDFKIVFKF